MRWAGAIVADVVLIATAPARGGKERERFRSERSFGSVDWQPLPRRGR